MRSHILHFIVLVLFVLLGSCESFLLREVEFSKEKEYYFEEFNELIFNDIFDISLINGDSGYIKVISPDPYHENILIQENSTRLIFSDTNPEKWFPHYPRPELIICFPRTGGKIILNSPVKISAPDTLITRDIRIYSLGMTCELDLCLDANYVFLVTGSDNFAYYSLRGKTRYLKVWPRGSSQVYAGEMEAEVCNVYNNSIGDCTLKSLKKLEVRMNTSGNVFYYGNPDEIEVIEISGSGRLIPLQN